MVAELAAAVAAELAAGLAGAVVAESSSAAASADAIQRAHGQAPAGPLVTSLPRPQVDASRALRQRYGVVEKGFVDFLA
jgi:hypothetical protein